MILKKKTDIGGEGEALVLEAYVDQGYQYIESNYYCNYGEIDLIFKKLKKIIFVEVKVVNNIDDIFDYISKKKLNFIKKSIDYYLGKNKSNMEIRLDIVFVKNGKILEKYENIEI